MSGCEEDIERPGAEFAGELSTIVTVPNSSCHIQFCIPVSPLVNVLISLSLPIIVLGTANGS
jgi:hypothetical protein